MSLDPRTPVLVGAGMVQQKLEDPSQALERAADDAGSRGLPLDHSLTETGGMPFVGGPLNSFVL